MSIREDLKAYLDGELDAARAAEIRKAIEADPDLQEEVRELELLSQEIRQFVDEPQVFGLERTLAALRPKQPWWSFGMSRLALAGGLGVVFILLGFGALNVLMKKEAAEETSTRAVLVSSEQAPVNTGDSTTLDYSGGVTTKKDAFTSGTSPQFENADETNLLQTDGGADKETKGTYKDAGAAAAPATSGTVAKAGANLPIAEHQPVPSAQLTVKVPNAQKAVEKATAIVKAHGGLLEANRLLDGDDDQAPVTKIVLKVPPERLSQAVAQLSTLEGMGELVSSDMADADANSSKVETPTVSGNDTREFAPMAGWETKSRSEGDRDRAKKEQDPTGRAVLGSSKPKMASVFITLQESGERLAEGARENARSAAPSSSARGSGATLLWALPAVLAIVGLTWWLVRRYARS